MNRVYPEDFDPYPGSFLKDDLEEKIHQSSRLLSEEYLVRGDINSSEEALNNIKLARNDAVPKSSPFQKLCVLQKRWKELMDYSDQEAIRSQIRDILVHNRG